MTTFTVIKLVVLKYFVTKRNRNILVTFYSTVIQKIGLCFECVSQTNLDLENYKCPVHLM